MACVWLRPNGKSRYWMARYTGEDGRRLNRSTKQENQKKAQAIADEWERMARKARAGELTKEVIIKTLGEMMERTTGEVLDLPSINEFFATWLGSKTTRGMPDSTVNRYRPILEGFIAFIGPRRAAASVASATTTEIARYHEAEIEAGKAASTADYAVSVLSAFFPRPSNRD